MVWLCKTKLWWKCKTLFYGYRQFLSYIKAYYVCKDIAENVETRFGTSNYEIDKPLLKVKNKKVIGLMKDELRGKILLD